MALLYLLDLRLLFEANEIISFDRHFVPLKQVDIQFPQFKRTISLKIYFDQFSTNVSLFLCAAEVYFHCQFPSLEGKSNLSVFIVIHFLVDFLRLESSK